MLSYFTWYSSTFISFFAALCLLFCFSSLRQRRRWTLSVGVFSCSKTTWNRLRAVWWKPQANWRRWARQLRRASGERWLHVPFQISHSFSYHFLLLLSLSLSFLWLDNRWWCRYRKAMEDRQIIDDDRIESLEHHVKEASETATEAERRYDEVGASRCCA